MEGKQHGQKHYGKNNEKNTVSSLLCCHKDWKQTQLAKCKPQLV